VQINDSILNEVVSLELPRLRPYPLKRQKNNTQLSLFDALKLANKRSGREYECKNTPQVSFKQQVISFVTAAGKLVG